MLIAIPKETAADERRAALAPDLVAPLMKAGLDVLVQTDAGAAAGFLDATFAAKGARIGPTVLGEADVVLKVQPPTLDEIAQLKEGAVLIGFLQPYGPLAAIQALAARRVTAFAMELMP